MKIISHRGNLIGPNPTTENSPSQINKALSLGFEVEVDLWKDKDILHLGHDGPAYEVSLNFIEQQRIWIHAKNLEAVEFLSKSNLHWFWHDQDKMTLTSNGYIWSYPGVYVAGGIVVECGEPFDIEQNISGVCTDFAIDWLNYRGESQNARTD